MVGLDRVKAAAVGAPTGIAAFVLAEPFIRACYAPGLLVLDDSAVPADRMLCKGAADRLYRPHEGVLPGDVCPALATRSRREQLCVTGKHFLLPKTLSESQAVSAAWSLRFQ